jgi:NAD(P)-dependent dehydrogenase (short-subunit alcohol dehydrogenase family)
MTIGPRLAGKRVFITGGGMGMGAEAARLFAEHGAAVALADVNLEAAEAVAGEIRAGGGSAVAARADVGIEGDVRGAVEDAAAGLGGLDVLYNNAGVLWKDRDRSVIETEEPDWDRVMAITLKSVFFTCKYGVPHLQAAGGGSIINIGSVSGLVGFTRAQDAYTSAKGALIALTKSLAIQFAKDRIRCNIIHPGIIDTPLQAPYLAQPGVREDFEASIPMGRLGQPRDIAYAALYLASDESSFMTGAELVIDGGFLAG